MKNPCFRLCDAITDRDLSSLSHLLQGFKADDELSRDHARLALNTAAQLNFLEGADMLMKAGVDPNWSSATARYIPLTISAEKGHEEMLKLLLEYGAHVNSYTSHGITALHRAVQNNHKSCINVLVSHGADCNAADATGATPICYAARHRGTANLNLLLKHCKKPKLNYTTSANTNPLMYAVEQNEPEKVTLLLSRGADPNFKDKWNKVTPLQLACMHGYHQIAEILIQARANINYLNTNHTSPLMNAAGEHHEQCVSLLISHGTDVNLTNDSKIKRKTPIMYAAKTNNVNIMKQLVEAGGDVNRQDHLGETSLHIAAKHGCDKNVEYLLNHGANPNITDNKGFTALFEVVKKTSQTHHRIAKTLIQYNTSLEKKGRELFEYNKPPLTVFDVALRANNVLAIKMLIIAGCNLRELHKRCPNGILLVLLKKKHPDVYDIFAAMIS